MSTTIELGRDDCALVFRHASNLKPVELFLPDEHDDDLDLPIQMKLTSALAILCLDADFVESVLDQFHEMIEANEEEN